MALLTKAKAPSYSPFLPSSLLMLHLRHNSNLSMRTRTLKGSCEAVTLSKEDKVLLLSGVDKNHVDIIGRVLEQARTAADRRNVFHTDFLTPPVLNDALSSIKRLANIKAVVSGGYAQAERCRLSVGKVEDLASKFEGTSGEGFPGAVAALSISGNFAFDPAEHGDFLGAVLSTGLTREKIGDVIVLGEKGAQLIVVPDLLNYLVTSLQKVRNVPVNCTPIPLTALQFLPPRKEVLNTVEASLRVDALASAGFRISRSKFVDLISSKDVKLNWREISKGGVTLKIGDVVSIRGKGRIEVGGISTTRKGRFSIELIRYV